MTFYEKVKIQEQRFEEALELAIELGWIKEAQEHDGSKSNRQSLNNCENKSS